MALTVKWYGDAVEKTFARFVAKGLTTAGRGLADDIRSGLGSSGGDEGSPGGQPPHRRTGALQGAIGFEMKDGGKAVRVGVTDRSQMGKAVRLARGFTGTDSSGAVRDDPPRPFVGSVVEKRKDRIVTDIAKGG